MIDRRSFLTKTSEAALGATFLPLTSTEKSLPQLKKPLDKSDAELITDESFWYQVQQCYVQNPHFINLEAGYFSPAANVTLEDQIDNVRMINESPSFYMRRKQFEERDALRQQLADFAGCGTDELIMTRNTTESLNIIIQGLTLKEGEEILRTNREYPSMIQALDQRQKRFGTPVKVVPLPLVPDLQEQIVQLIEKAVTSKTKVILVSFMTYLTGQVLPVKEICALAHKKGIEVIVDGAHAFAHVPFKISDLDCDYFACSLHKWLCAPLGNGLLYVKKGKASKIWPLFGDTDFAEDNIKKLEHFGTQPCANQLSIAAAIRFHESIGSSLKASRLNYLKHYWVSKVKSFPKIKINTPLGEGQSYAICNLGVEGMSPNELVDTLYSEYKIFTVAIDNDDIQGARIAPHLYTTIKELDKLVEALTKIVSK
ncbi:aminotransferase class V-fold PLP-dependent enzyme [Imperialibacter roseus]|uniref:Aminotransferase class V-fold PLP-dependent enzyme n=1 Tax=Imperialibacter roseus TaxID=1324217 RepID=A0ABZ0IS08_9BACT|nr:aminotransferase class V-fold PLP-dependent enzyme [Imperialibacter roseus]WOK07531.1 aminotransferase class V-fold PLP-dependent enzyme [Imperialibacter roseus]